MFLSIHGNLGSRSYSWSVLKNTFRQVTLPPTKCNYHNRHTDQNHQWAHFQQKMLHFVAEALLLAKIHSGTDSAYKQEVWWGLRPAVFEMVDLEMVHGVLRWLRVSVQACPPFSMVLLEQANAMQA